MKKVCLIGLPFPFAEEQAMNPPLGLCYVSAAIKKKTLDWDEPPEVIGIDYTTRDHNYDSPEWVRDIPLDCDVYGITSMSCQVKWLKVLVEYLYHATDNSIVVVGGPHASDEPEHTIMNVGADIAVRGDGEHVIPSLLMGEAWDEIPGVCFNDKIGLHLPPHHYEPDLDSLPMPDRDLFGLHNYKRRLNHKKAVHLVTLRGCPFNCAFCDRDSVGRTVRYRSVNDVMMEIEYIKKQYGISSFVIYDDIFILDIKRAEELCDRFAAANIEWRCWSRTDILVKGGKRLLKRMMASGMTQITFGVESGDDKVLELMNKGSTREDNRQALLMCKEAGVPVRCSLMYGNPGESRVSLQNTIDLIEECQPDEWNLAVLIPTPGSPYWNNPEEYPFQYDKDAIIANDFESSNRFGDSGIGTIQVSVDTMTDEEFKDNLKWFVAELERVCPRKQIQDTIQTIDTEEL